MRSILAQKELSKEVALETPNLVRLTWFFFPRVRVIDAIPSDTHTCRIYAENIGRTPDFVGRMFFHSLGIILGSSEW